MINLIKRREINVWRHKSEYHHFTVIDNKVVCHTNRRDNPHVIKYIIIGSICSYEEESDEIQIPLSMYWLGNQCFEITSRRENVVSNAYYWNMNVVTQSWLTYVLFAVSSETISILWICLWQKCLIKLIMQQKSNHTRVITPFRMNLKSYNSIQYILLNYISIKI